MFKVLDEFVFLRIVKKYDGDKYVKHFSCGNQLITLMFGQLTGKPSLRRFIIASAPIQKKFYSLGMGRTLPGATSQKRIIHAIIASLRSLPTGRCRSEDEV